MQPDKYYSCMQAGYSTKTGLVHSSRVEGTHGFKHLLNFFRQVGRKQAAYNDACGLQVCSQLDI